MKKSLYILLAIISGTLMSCTHNNGDIGDWFGTWKMESMVIDDGRVDSGYNGDIIWKFQSDIVLISQVNDVEHSTINSFGTWVQLDDTLLLNFTYSDNSFPEPGTGPYCPPSVTRIPSGESTMTIRELSGSKIVLSFTDSSGSVIVYTLKKWG